MYTVCDDTVRCIYAYVTATGKVYTFGDGANGQLGLGTSLLQSSVPAPIDIDFKVTNVSCGENHTAILSGMHSMDILLDIVVCFYSVKHVCHLHINIITIESFHSLQYFEIVIC